MDDDQAVSIAEALDLADAERASADPDGRESVPPTGHWMRREVRAGLG
jgi:hypothetical protein